MASASALPPPPVLLLLLPPPLLLLLRRRSSARMEANPSLLLLLALRCFTTLAVASSAAAATTSYANVTLRNENGDLSVVVFLPSGLKPAERTFYYASRFDHGSMIGVVGRKSRRAGGVPVTHQLFEADMWRVPHNSNWPESGVGLASEFGVGDDGNFCYYRCGWSGADDVTNGVLGYAEAKNGEPFLKIGVGHLLKGTCPTCDPTDDYKFNSPYLFAEPPVWLISQMSDRSLTLEHEATLRVWGYRLVKDVVLDGNRLTVTSTLMNLGQSAFTTAWYSHNFFACDQNAVGPGYEVDLDVRKTGGGNPYDEPGTWSWSSPLADYAKVRAYADKVRVEMVRALTPGVRIKAEFNNDGQTKGDFTLRACDTEIRSTLEHPDQRMYAYNLYVERATLSPEPQILIHLEPGQATSWTQRLDIRGLEDEEDGDGPSPTGEWREANALPPRWSWTSPRLSLRAVPWPLLLVGCAAYYLLLLGLWPRTSRIRQGYYAPIPDEPEPFTNDR